jgi:hypothetical protein
VGRYKAGEHVSESQAVALYGILVARSTHEGTLFWTRYSAFFAILSALAFAWANTVSSVDSAFFGSFIMQGALVVAGTIVAFSWFLVAVDGAKWQEYFSQKIQEIENEHQCLPVVFTNITEPRILPDVVAVAITISFVSCVSWVVAAFLNKIELGVIAVCSCVLLTVLSRIAQRVLSSKPKQIAVVDNEQISGSAI